VEWDITVILTSLSLSAMKPTVYQDLECFATEAVLIVIPSTELNWKYIPSPYPHPHPDSISKQTKQVKFHMDFHLVSSLWIK